ncbi:hypothetical protein EDC91_10730 [Shewanella fodinae]|uniref:Uncharacterized protein n=1 Tax=Shewanella fodinae TaxID=552357 RepID=A0A4R2FC92_9GAMM|nr:hypothetical protein EDC91_10730 [Shewanella fodinae]
MDGFMRVDVGNGLCDLVLRTLIWTFDTITDERRRVKMVALQLLVIAVSKWGCRQICYADLAVNHILDRCGLAGLTSGEAKCQSVSVTSNLIKSGGNIATEKHFLSGLYVVLIHSWNPASLIIFRVKYGLNFFR